ncbi:MAG: Xaa-Pro peptidase family protein [bacterium]|nr:Xaa-Pro peptidase family protein [bacterium]
MEGCKQRQQRLRARLVEEGVDAVVLTDHLEIYYFTGVLLSKFPSFYFPAFFLLETQGDSWLAAHTDEGDAVVGERVLYEWHKLYTLNPDPMRQLNQVVSARLKGERRASRVGWQAEGLPKLLADTVARHLRPDEWVAVDDLLVELHKKKDADEIVLMRKSIQADLAAYTRAQEVIAPGVNEMEVLAACQQAAAESVGEVIYHGGDYQCGTFGGTARNRAIKAGELYIIDAQSVYRGYWADLARTFVVGGKPTELQASVFAHLAAILEDVPALVRPGGSATELWKTLDARIREHPHLAVDGLVHHGGHGVGVRPHEAPDLNRDRDGVFEVGDVFSCEPGGYSEALNMGVRVENTFWVTENGVENLVDYPLNLIPGG